MPKSTVTVKHEVKREPREDVVDLADSPEEELIATNPGGGDDDEDRAPQTQDEYFRLMGFTRVEEAGRGEWLTKEYAKKRQKAGLLDDPEESAPTEMEILLQERLPDNSDKFKDPLTNWIPCPGQAPIPSWNKAFLPEEPLERPPTPVKIDNSIYKWIVKEKENPKLEEIADEDDTVVVVKEGAMIRVGKKIYESSLRENSFRGRPSSRGAGRGFSRGSSRPSHGQGRYRPHSRERSRSPGRHRSTGSRLRSSPSRHRSPPSRHHRSPPSRHHRSSFENSGRHGGSSSRRRSPDSSPEEYRRHERARTPTPPRRSHGHHREEVDGRRRDHRSSPSRPREREIKREPSSNDRSSRRTSSDRDSHRGGRSSEEDRKDRRRR